MSSQFEKVLSLLPNTVVQAKGLYTLSWTHIGITDIQCLIPDPVIGHGTTLIRSGTCDLFIWLVVTRRQIRSTRDPIDRVRSRILEYGFADEAELKVCDMGSI